MTFGVFDRLHPGHEYFLRTASAQCERLVVVVTPNSVVRELKNHAPRESESKRINNVRQLMPEAEVVLGDAIPNSWEVLAKYRPAMVFLGYDQQDIAQELEKLKVHFTYIDAHKPEKYKSSLINK